MSVHFRGWWFAAAACLYFIGAGLALIPHLGIQGDEALFAQAVYPPRYELFALRLGGAAVPLMLMSYLGALKSWIYWPILHLFGAGVISVRLPMLLAGAASVWLLYMLLRRIAGERAAAIGAMLLATDATYLVTTCFDWGPVALQHLLILGGGFLLLKFYQERQTWALAGGWFLLGLALWDKALATWMLSGLAVAALLVFPRQLLAVLTIRRTLIAVAAFSVGALPLMVFNAAFSFRTFRDNLHRDNVSILRKARVLADTAGANGLFGYLTARDSDTPAPYAPVGALQRASVAVSEWTRHPRRGLLLYGFALALLAALFIPREHRRALVFCLVAMAVAWMQMALTANAGASVHHTILLWPLPTIVVALAFAHLKRAGIALVAVIMASGILVDNEYHAAMLRNGGGRVWNPAVSTVAGYLRSVPAKYVLCLDWGILDPLRLLSEGTLPLGSGSADSRDAALRMVSEPDNVFIDHTPEFAVLPANSEKLGRYAQEAGYRREMLAVIPDAFGRRVFEVYRFAAAASIAPERLYGK